MDCCLPTYQIQRQNFLPGLGWMELLVSEVGQHTTGLSQSPGSIFFFILNRSAGSAISSLAGLLSSGASLSHLPADLHRGQKARESIGALVEKSLARSAPLQPSLKFHFKMRFPSTEELWRLLWWRKKKKKKKRIEYWHESKTHYGNTLNLLTIHGVRLQMRS